jgi:DNA-directed RNA polymerase beta subunit
VTDEIVYLAADEEEEHHVAQANARLDDEGHFMDERVPARFRDAFPEARPNQIEYMDVSPKQVVSVATALIPFLEHDDANRALMGSNMQRQAVPLLEPEAPIVGTGMEGRAALDSGQVVVAKRSGTVRPSPRTGSRLSPRRAASTSLTNTGSISSSAATRAHASTSVRSSRSGSRSSPVSPSLTPAQPRTASSPSGATSSLRS